jgi:hypothetical protein
MASLTINMEVLEKCLAKYCNPLFSILMPPLPDEVRDQLFASIELDEPSIKQVYQWKNGINYDNKMPRNSYDFSGFGVIPSLEYLVEKRKKENEDNLWKKTMIPIVTDFGGNFILFESDKKSNAYGQLFLYSPTMGHVDFPMSYFDSLDTMIKTICRWFEEEAFQYDQKEMYLDIDFDKQYDIGRKYNPISKYWQQ